MRQITLYFILLLAPATTAGSAELTLTSQAEIWMDETTKHAITKTLMPAAKDELAVRALLAGVMNNFAKASLLLVPEEIRFGKFLGHPACFIRGLSLADFSRRHYGIVMVFTVQRTYAIQHYSPEGEPLPDVEKYVRCEGDPSQETEAAFAYIAPRVKDFIAQHRELVQKLAATIEKTPNPPPPEPKR